MPLPQRIAGDAMALITIWLTWALLAPVVADTIQAPAPPHTCPAPQMIHGVGANLQTYTRPIDRCVNSRTTR